MAQVTTGLRAVLNFPKIYNLNQGIIGASRFRKEIVDQYIRPQNQMKILDLGCGTGEVLDHLPHGIVYLGLDLSEEYIAEARQRRGDRGTFHAGRAEEAEWLASQQFDLVLAIGVLHHLGDAEAEAMMAISRSALNAGGRMVTVDPCLHEQQSSSARFLIGKDRGQNVRTEQGYRKSGSALFLDFKKHGSPRSTSHPIHSLHPGMHRPDCRLDGRRPGVIQAFVTSRKCHEHAIQCSGWLGP